MHPAGDLFLGGLASTVTFFKNALDQLGVAVELVRIAEYKGAMEPFVFSTQSQPVRDNRNALLDDLYGRLKAGITRARARAWGSTRSGSPPCSTTACSRRRRPRTWA